MAKKVAKKQVVKKKPSKKQPSGRKPTPKGHGGTQGVCFTIMPFGGWHDVYYDQIFKPAIRKANLEPRRADDIFKPSVIVEDIWDLTLSSTVVLAELTGKNPNVLYELGLAHACAKPAVLVSQTLDDVPFDLQSLRIILYEKDAPKWSETLKKSIAELLLAVLDNPAASVPSAFSARRPPGPGGSGQKLTVRQRDEALRQENERLKRRMRQVAPSDYSVGEIEHLVLRYLNQGIPLQEIRVLLRKRGIPNSLLYHVLEDVSRRFPQ